MMPFAGKQLQPREIVSHVAGHWPNSKVKAVATALGESAGFIGAWHDNMEPPDNITVLSRDCGLFQINIENKYIGTTVEDNLRTESTDPAVYEPIARNNTDAAYRLYETPWTRDGT